MCLFSILRLLILPHYHYFNMVLRLFQHGIRATFLLRSSSAHAQAYSVQPKPSNPRPTCHPPQLLQLFSWSSSLPLLSLSPASVLFGWLSKAISIRHWPSPFFLPSLLAAHRCHSPMRHRCVHLILRPSSFFHHCFRMFQIPLTLRPLLSISLQSVLATRFGH